MTEGIRGGHCPQSSASFAQVAEFMFFFLFLFLFSFSSVFILEFSISASAPNPLRNLHKLQNLSVCFLFSVSIVEFYHLKRRVADPHSPVGLDFSYFQDVS